MGVISSRIPLPEILCGPDQSGVTCGVAQHLPNALEPEETTVGVCRLRDAYDTINSLSPGTVGNASKIRTSLRLMIVVLDIFRRDGPDQAISSK
jgi:hypothetical protein